MKDFKWLYLLYNLKTTNPLEMIRFVGILFLLLVVNLTQANGLDNCENEVVTPQVVAPADVVVSCCYWFSLGSLDDPTNPTFGRFVYGQQNIQKFKTIDKVCESWCEYDSYIGYDPDIETAGKACEHYRRYYSPAHPDEKHPLVWGWDGYVNGATSAVEISVDDRRHCGTGLIVRRFTIEDRGVLFYDEQRIWIIDCRPFYVSPDCTDPDDDIEWPLFCRQPDPLDGCYADLSPDNPRLGRPRVVNGADDQCNLISIDFKDDTITVEEGACLKVLRTWSVVDWCQYHPLKNPGQGKWEYLQVIKVRDKLDPEIQCFIGDCTPASKDSLGDCYGYIELRAKGVDSCTVEDHLRYEYKIDLYNDGKGKFGDYDLRVGPLSKLDESPSITENPLAEYADSVLNASGTYPIGQHRIKWFVEDGCANVALCDTTFEILDCKAPTPYCKTGIITVVMPVNGMIEVWASDLNDGSFDNCSDQEALVYSFSSDSSHHSMVFDCDSIGQHKVEIWVTDEEGNKDFCTTTIEIQDPQNICPNSIITGTVTAGLQGKRYDMSDAKVRLWQDGKIVDQKPLTGNTFQFNIAGLTGDLEIDIELNTTPLNGVATSDLVMIHRFLLGRDAFAMPEYKAAADVNGDCKLSVGDITYLQKVILGHKTDFREFGLNSWIFVPIENAGYDPTHFCVTNSKYSIDRNDLLASYDFMPLKLGDVMD